MGYVPQAASPGDASPRWAGVPELLGLWEAAEALARAEDAALKRIADLDMQRAQLRDVAQVGQASGGRGGPGDDVRRRHKSKNAESHIPLAHICLKRARGVCVCVF